MRRILSFIIFIGIALLFCVHVYNPYLISIPNFREWTVLILSTGLLIEGRLKRRVFKHGWFIIFLMCTTLVTLKITSHQSKARVLSQNPQTLYPIGRHLIVGYRDFSEIKTLVEHGAIGGVFLTQRNIVGKSIEQVRQEIDTLQNIQKNLGLPKLIIAADQEGGSVSRLSPPLPKQPTLGEFIDTFFDDELIQQKATAYGKEQGRGLESIGVTLNLSPVVDLKPTHKTGGIDVHSQIRLRAIHEDPRHVTKAALAYVQSLGEFKIKATLKHFPGLGRVSQDTHLFSASLSDVNELASADWLPFRTILKSTNSAMMLGHVRLTPIDAENPVSVSKKVVEGLIRNEWQANNLLITDDLAMGPIYTRKGGCGQGALDALNAGVDLVLLSFDGSLYYPVMDFLLDANRKGKVDWVMLEKSRERLEK